MKKFKKSFFTILFTFLCTLFISVDTKASDKVDLIFTSDLHSYIESYDQVIDGQQKNVGGFARLKSFIDQKKAINPDTLLVDCGDVVMGTLPQALIDKDAFELCFLSEFGYDAATVGNHEFDYGAEALANMYRVAARKESYRPAYVQCNIDWTQNNEYTKTLKAGIDEYGTSKYTVIEKNGVRIGIVGCLGIDAQKCASTCELTFLNAVQAVKDTVAELKAKENPDMIICLSHSGTGDKLGKTEDEELAKAVPDLDVIVSGHTHTVLEDYISVGNTYIISCGEYGYYVGEASLTKKSDGRWSINNYKLNLMDETIPEDPQVLSQIDEINEAIDEKVLAPYGLEAEEVIAKNPGIQFENVNDLYSLHTETKLGNLLSDSYRVAANNTPTAKEHRFDLAVAPSGTIRGTFVDGDITVSKAFESLSLGMGADGKVGYPLVNFYITGKEIKTMAEVDASISDIMNSARLYTSGVCFEYNPHRLLLNKIVDTWISSPIMEESRTEIVDDEMYRVVTDFYTMTMLGSVTDLSKGILSIIPKDEAGNPVTDYNQRVVYDAEGNELKAWTAVAYYLSSFAEGDDGVSLIPEYYNSLHNRKVVNDSWNPIELVKNSNRIFYIIVLVIILLITIIVIIAKTIKKKKNKRKVLY